MEMRHLHTHMHTLKGHTSNTRLIRALSPGQDIAHLFSKWTCTHIQAHAHTNLNSHIHTHTFRHTHSDHILTLSLSCRGKRTHAFWPHTHCPVPPHTLKYIPMENTHTHTHVPKQIGAGCGTAVCSCGFN